MTEKFFIGSQSIVFVAVDVIGESAKTKEGVTIQVGTINPADKAKFFAYYVNEYDLPKAKVVEKSWEVAERPQYHDVFAKLTYSNGISFTADFTKLVFADAQPETNVEDKNFLERAKSLFSVVDKKVKIQSVGINFSLMLPCDKAEDKFYNDYLNTKIFGQLEKSIENPHVRVSYKTSDHTKLNVNLYTADTEKLAKKDLTADKCIVLDANYHHEVCEGHDNINEMLSKFDEKVALLAKLVPLRR